MAYKFREEIVGKRFLSVSSDFSKLKVNKISEWGWRSGVIRAASHRDNNCHDLQVLVEYDDVEWHRREWLSPHRDTAFTCFLIEKGLFWAERIDPRQNGLTAIDQYNHNNHTNNNHRINGKSKGSTSANTVAWPAIAFYPLVAREDLHEDMMPVEFINDKKLEFVDYDKLKPFTQDWELTKASLPWANSVRRWAEMQDGQRILLTTPSVLVGFRVEVYRAEGTTQWYTAVIVGYNESTKDLTVTDDTVLEEHNEDPRLVQMRLIGDGVVESIMRGEVVGMTPRRSRSSTGLMTHAIVVPRVPRRPRGRPVTTSLTVTQPVSQQLEKDKGIGKKNRTQKVNEVSVREKTESRQEDRENKGPVISSVKPSNRGPRSSVLEETNSLTKLRKRGAGGTGAVTGGSAGSGSGAGSGVGLKNVETNRRVRGRRGRPTDESRRNDRDRLNATTKDKEQVRDQDHLRSEDEGETEEEETVEGGEEEVEDEESEEESDSKLKTRLRSARQDNDLNEDKKEVKQEKHQEEDKKFKQEKNKVEESNVTADTSLADVKPEEDESESRERDREPEPPPSIPDTLDPGGNDCNITCSKTTTTAAAAAATIATAINKEVISKLNSDSVTKLNLSTSPSDKQASELVERTNKDGSVLERLSPLNAGPGRLNLLHDEQERSRHNESPVILAERINKPPVSASGNLVHQHQHHHHHQQQQLHHQHQEHQQHLQQYQHLHPRYTSSPVIHRLDSASPHSQHRAPYPSAHHQHHQHQHPQQQQHQSNLETSDKSQASNHHLVQHQQQQHHHQLSSSRHGDEAGHIMEMETGGNGAGGFPGVPGAVASGVRGATTYGDSGSDSGISSLRSAGSGDERSGSRSSALSAEETTATTTTTPAAAAATTTTTTVPPSPAGVPTTPARIWHVHSVQHTSLMMAHTPQSTGSTIPVSAPPVGYQSPAAVAAATAASHHHHPSAEMLWRPPRYPPLPHGLLAPGQPIPAEELLERDRHERIIRERREAEARELEKQQQREAKMDLEKLEKQKAAEQAVHKHFEESFRLAHQRRNMSTASAPWSNFVTLPPPGSRSHGAPPSHAGLPSHGHHHPGPGGATHPSQVTSQQQHQQQQQQQQERQRREREEHDARERERERDVQAREREREHLAAAERLHRQAEAREHHRAAAYYAATAPSAAQQVLRPSSVPSKVEYPPPPAHSRTSKSSLSVVNLHDKQQVVGPPHSSLPKAEPNVSLFSYSGYPPPQMPSYVHDIKVKNDLQLKPLPGKSLGSHERDHHGRELVQNQPPQLLSDHKSSVIVKNDQGRGNDLSKVPPPHSSSPKMMSYMVQPVAPPPPPPQVPQQPTHKTPVAYEYRSPTQSPHHLHHLESLQAKGIPSHHRSASGHNQSPHGHPSSHSHNRQSPHSQPHPHQTPHPSPPESRYLNRPEPGLLYASSKPSYSYPHQPNASPTSHYTAPPGSKPKVSSPAPPHIYGNPGPGILTGTPVCRASEPAVPAPLPLTSKATGSSPYQQVPHHHGSAPPSRTLPPPAHTRPPYDSRGFPVGSSLPASKLPPPLHGSPSTVASAPLSRPTVPHPSHHVSPHQPGCPPSMLQHPPVAPFFQTQPLDLGVERSVSPKRKASTPTDHLGQPVSLEIKKRRTEEPPTPLSLQCGGPPVLSRVSEPSPLIASAATSITTVVNNALLVQPTTINPTINATTINNNPNNNINNNNNNSNNNNNNTSINTENVQTHQLQQQSQSQSQQQQLQQEPAVIVSVSPAPRTASADGSVRPASTGSVSSLHQQQITTSSAPSPAPTASPAPATSAPSPAPPSAPGTPAKTPVNNTDSEKSNSPAPRPPSRTNYPVHKLKKAWLQRHSGEDGTEDTTGVVGSGSCVTLPLNSAQAPSQPLHKERESTTSNSNNSTSNTTTSLPSAVNSIHNIGSMAVNSINKTKGTGKAGRKPKETLNGHTNDGKNLQEDSSSSDPERKSPPKRKPPKVKRKKGAPRRQQAAVEEQRRRKDDKQVTGSTGSTATANAAGSDSSNESEAGSASDTSEQLTSSSSIQPTPKRNTTPITNSNTNSNNSTGNGNTNREPRKRGRRPKNSKGNDAAGGEDQPRSKKDRKEDSSSGNGGAGGEGGGNGGNGQGGNGKSNPFCKPPTSQLKKTGDSWLQDLACCEVAPKLAKCRECRYLAKSPLSRIKKQTVFCRFYAFRRLRYTKNGQLAIAGFSDPLKDASEEDVQLWLPGNLDQHSREKDEKTEKNDKDKGADRLDLDKEMAYRLLRQVGDQFCDLLRQEKEALSEHIADADNGLVDSTVAWKRVVQGVREMCDVCETTLFNYHWVCAKCGFAVCIDCFKGRKNGTVTIWGESGKDRDDFGWLLCTNRQVHAPDRLMLTQIIAGDSLPQLGQRLHDVRAEWGIPQHCDCPLVSSTPPSDVLRNSIKGDSVTVSTNGNIKQEIKEENKSGDTANGSSDSKTNGEENSPLNWLADVALQNQDKNDSGSSSDSDEDRDGNYSTLRELLIRPSHKPNGTGSRSNSPTNVNSPGPTSNNIVKQGKKSKMDALDEVISSVIEHTAKEEREAGESGEKTCELKHFVRRYKWTERGREPLPIRIMTLTESKSLYPDVPHSWLCNGKLLRLNEPHNVNNYRIFQDQWKRGQPVIVSDVSKSLNMDLWHPDSFARDFGDEKNDLINCMTGHTVPHQPMRKFWEGFEHFGKRLKDDKGNPMLLKLKDWPPGEDFAELLPSRYADLMKVLPLSEYTHRNGRLNLASRLPDCFVRPDLGPKMYNAYGSALYSNKGTTNLHLDISDAVNVMVYVGIPQDGDSEEHIKEALRAVDEAGCDILTRRRVRERGEAPGALWHIYAARDADKIRDLLNAVALERGARLEPHHDPIHDQSCYLDGHLRERLYREYGVEGYAIVQCLGDAVFVPAGAPHQVRNLHNCIKVAEDFVSPENVSHCFHLTQEFRALSDTHTNHEDKLQIKNIIYHAVKDSLTVLANAKEEALQAAKAKSSEVKVKDEPKRET